MFFIHFCFYLKHEEYDVLNFIHDTALLYLDKDLIYIKSKRIDANQGWECDLKIKLYSIDKTIFEILSIGKSLYNEKIIEIYLNNKFEINFYNNINQSIDIPQRIIQVRDEKFHSINDYLQFHQFIYQNNYFSYLNINELILYPSITIIF